MLFFLSDGLSIYDLMEQLLKAKAQYNTLEVQRITKRIEAKEKEMNEFQAGLQSPPLPTAPQATAKRGPPTKGKGPAAKKGKR